MLFNQKLISTVSNARYMLSCLEQPTIKKPAVDHKITLFEPILRPLRMYGTLPMTVTNNPRINECSGEFITKLCQNDVSCPTDSQGDSLTDSCQTSDFDAKLQEVVFPTMPPTLTLAPYRPAMTLSRTAPPLNDSPTVLPLNDSHIAPLRNDCRVVPYRNDSRTV